MSDHIITDAQINTAFNWYQGPFERLVWQTLEKLGIHRCKECHNGKCYADDGSAIEEWYCSDCNGKGWEIRDDQE